MSTGQSAPAPAAAPAPAPVVAPPAAQPVPQAQAQPRRLDEDVPQLLNRLQVAAVAICLAFGVIAGVLQLVSWQAGGQAAENTEQLVRVQSIETSLYRADAVATDAYLFGGLEPAERRADYDEAIASVLDDLARAAEAQPADREALAALAAEVNRYTTAITQARDNNRQGYPVGKAYLAEASTALRGQSAAVLDALVAANTERAEDAMEPHHPIWLLLLGALAIAGLWFVNREIAKRFRRRFNRGLLAAAVIVLLVAFLGSSHASSRNGTGGDLRDGAFDVATKEATARTAASDARAQESKRLINRASGDSAEEPWLAAAAVVDENTSRPDLWDYYRDVHGLVVRSDDDGDWEAAVAQSTSGSADAYEAYDVVAADVVATSSEEVADGLRGGVLGLLLAVLTLLAGLLASGAVAWGINERRREYS